MKHSKYILPVLATAIVALAVSSCDKGWLSGDRVSNAAKGVGMMFRTPSSTSLSETKAAAAPVLNKVYGSEDDGFVIEEYVSDIEDVMRTPETKGTEIKQLTASSGNFNVADRQFQVMAFLDTTKTMPGGVETTYHINEFNYPVKYDGTKWNWVLNGDDALCWRTSTKYSIWSYWPIDDDVTLGSRSAVSEPDGGNWATSGKYNTVSFTHTVPKALEDQQDLLFAYNEETRDFAHIDGDKKKKYVYEGKEQAWIDNTGNDSQIFDGTNGNPKSRGIDIHFYHALAAVKFELNTSVTGADVHSITLCYVDGSGNIVTSGEGIATTGNCTATGNPASTEDKVTFAWTNQGTKKPLHYEFVGSSQSVAGGYTKTGNGVLFMIPQTVQNIRVIVEFSKNGGTHYYTKVRDLGNVTWEAGRFYTYKLSISEFHVPGELLAGISSIKKSDFAKVDPNTGKYGQKILTNDLLVKGVTKVGVACSAASMKVNNSGAVVLVFGTAVTGGIGDYTTGSIQTPKDDPNPFSFNFLTYDTTSYTPGSVIKFGKDNTLENYKSFYHYKYGDTIATNYVFDTTGFDRFNMILYYGSGNNGNWFQLDTNFIMVLEVEEDPYLPGNFNTIDWSAI